MKKTMKQFCGVAILLGAGLPVWADSVVRMQRMTSVPVHAPVLTDEKDIRGEKPDLNRLMLEAKVPLWSETGLSREIIAADSAGVFHLTASGADSPQLTVYQTTLRASRFYKTQLSVKSPCRYEVYINGERKVQKLELQDSLSHAKVQTIPLTMEPEVLYRVAVKVLSQPGDTCASVLSMEWKAPEDTTLQVACAPELKGRYLLPNTVFGSRVGGVSVSPDGKYLLTKYSDQYSIKRSNTYYVLSEVKGGRKLTTFTQGAKVMSWTPSSKLYYTATSDEGMKLIVVNPGTLEEKVVADHLPEGRFSWSPDEQALYFTDVETVKGDSGPVHRLLNPDDRVPGSRVRSFIARFNLQTGMRERLTYGARTSWLQDVSRDGRYLLYTVSESTPDQWPFSSSSLFRLDLQTLKADTLVKEDAFMSSALFSPDGTQVLLSGGPEAFGEIGKNCGNHPIANNYDTQAYIMDIKERKIRPITKDFNPSILSAVWSASDGNIYCKVADGAQESVYRYFIATERWERLPLQGDCIRALSLADEAPVMAYTSVTASSSAAGFLYDAKKNRSQLIADPYAAVLDKLEMGTVKDWNFVASDGTEITGYYCLPPSFDASKKYPVIVYYYGGTTPTTKSMDSPYAAQLFASRNYVVYVVNPSGTIGFGQEFSARHVNAWGKRTAEDIIEGTRRFCEAHPFVDSARIGCLGASYGGFMTQYLQTQTDLFAAAASHAGISNVTSYWGEGYWGVGYNATAAAKSYPWTNPDLFTRQGSLFNADKIHTPLLLLHGTADTNVPVGESIQLYNALKILGKPVEFIQVDGENHFISDYEKRVKWHASIMAWFAKWLQGDSSWWNAMYPEYVK